MSFKEIHISAPSKLILHGEHAVVYGKTAVAASLDLRTRMTIKFPQELVEKYGKNLCDGMSSNAQNGDVTSNDNTTLGYVGARENDGNGMVTVNFPDVGINESWNLDIIQKLLLKRPKIINRHENHCSKCWTFEDFRTETNGSINEAFLLEICAFLNTSKADLRMQSLVCFFYLYSHLCGPDAIPLDISVASDIPLGAGLGSSAALSVCLSAGLLTIQDLTKSCIGCKQDTLPKICTKNTEMSCERLKLICDFAYISEQILHGRPSGIDNTTSTYGGLIQFSNFEVVFPTLSNDVSDLKRKTPKINILLVNTKVPKNTKLMVQKVTNRFKENPSETKEIIDEIDQLAKSSLELLTGRDNINLDSTSFKKWGQIIDRNHYLLGNGLGVSHPKLETVCKLASKYGLHAKLTGAGGGGFAFIILPSDLPTNIIDGIKEELVNIDCDVRETTLGASGGVEINLL